MNITKIKSEIEKIKDPDLGLSLLDMNAVESVNENAGKINIVLNLQGPVIYVKDEFNRIIRQTLDNIESGIEFELDIKEIYPDISGRPFLRKVKNIIAVSSGKGGVGKSSIAANITAALSKKGAKVGILDGDVYGPSQPTMFGVPDGRLEAKTFADGETMAGPVKQYGIKVASMGFVLNRDEAAIVRGPMLASYFSLLFEQVDWGELDYLIFDLPPGTGDIQLTMTQKIPLNGAVIVTTPQEIALADVRRSISMFQKVNVSILGIVENMSYFVPDDMPEKKYYIFGKDGGKDMAFKAGVPLLGQVPLSIKMREDNDGGKPIVLSDEKCIQSEVLADVAKNLTSELRRKNFEAMYNQTEISL